MTTDKLAPDGQFALNRRELLRHGGLAAAALSAGTFAAAPVRAQQQAAPVDGRGPVWTPIPMPDPVAQTEGKADIGGGEHLYYWDTGGDGEPLVLMHAGTGSAASWGYQQPYFAKAGYRVIAYSRRSYLGSSAGDKNNPGLGAEDLGKLLDHLGIDKAHILAAAHGGYFALDFALMHPERVRSLTLLSSLMGIKDEDYNAVGKRIRPDFFRTLPHSFQELSPSYRAGDPHGLELWEKLAEEALPGERVNPALSEPNTWARIETLACPTLLITGDGDLYLPPAMLRMQAQHIARAEVRIIDEAGHCANWERPDVFNAMLLDFLKRNAA
ncbi:alpha/beta hydrolase [Gemmobacter sp.]|uniref:alpha/beta fold hydrolase n=1 Tax=Gemmobacter sp. TaxID=1898957 RepID=UPI002AFFD962|nr:alpha/beta hydrolase [Gemmobacter sp.]